MKSWVKICVVAVFIFLWCYLAFTGLVKLPELDILKDMASSTKSAGNKIEWKTVDLYNRSFPEDVNKKDVSLTTGTIKIEIPVTENEWIKTAEQFETMWQFNNCIGVMDGKHVLINKPPGTGSLFYNYKGTFSVVLFAVVNANYEFLYVHTGTNGSVSDGGVLKHTKFHEKLTCGELNLPRSSLLPGTNTLAPYVFLGDSAFAISKHLLKPFPQKNINHEKRIFNYRLSRARRVVENVFGILSSRFRIFQKPMLVDVQNVDAIVLASCALHNFLRKKSNMYITNRCVDYEDIENEQFREGDWRQEPTLLRLDRNNQRQHTEDGKNVRNVFTEYFNGRGSVEFQERMINVLVIMTCRDST